MLGFSRFSAQEYDIEINFRTSVSPMLFSPTEKRPLNKWIIIRFVPAVSVLVDDLRNTTVAFAMKILTLNMRLKQTRKDVSLHKIRFGFEPKKQRNTTRLDWVRFFNPFCKL